MPGDGDGPDVRAPRGGVTPRTGASGSRIRASSRTRAADRARAVAAPSASPFGRLEEALARFRQRLVIAVEQAARSSIGAGTGLDRAAGAMPASASRYRDPAWVAWRWQVRRECARRTTGQLHRRGAVERVSVHQPHELRCKGMVCG